MTHNQHVDLIKNGITEQGGAWADFGSGDGAFTLALRDLAGQDVKIYSIDKDKTRLENQKNEFKRMFPDSDITFLAADFTNELELPPLDGIVMANSLHYVKEQVDFLKSIQNYLKPNGKLVLVEYETDEGNSWVPYPLSFRTFTELAKQVGFKKNELLKKIPSAYWNEIYAAVATI